MADSEIAGKMLAGIDTDHNKVGFFETLSVTFAPRASARAFASGRVIVSSVPVSTSVLPAISLLAASARRRHYLATRHGIVPLMARLRRDRIVPAGSRHISAPRFRHDPRAARSA